jgi:preprotein translocase subunit SecF
LNLGIDFAGGILIEAKFEQKVELEQLRKILPQEKFGEVSLQNFDEQNFMIKVSQNKNIDQSKIVNQIKADLDANFSNVEYRKIDFVGPQIGKELIGKGILALVLSFAAIMVYIWIRFDWQFGFGAILSLLHDAIMVFGLFAFTGLEFNSTSIAAILTVIGYSINDSVVIYDRIRENLQKFKKANLSDLINMSLNSTLSRTFLTSITTLLSLTALMIFGGETLKGFSVAVFFGILVGTYSSIYISAPVLLYMDPRNKKNKKSD